MTDPYLITDDQTGIEAITLWQTQLFITQNPYHNLLKEALIRLIYQDVGTEGSDQIKSDVAVTAKKHLMESELDFLDQPDADVQTLNVYLSELINMIATELNQPFWPDDAESETTLIESWYHVTRHGGYHDIHSHPNCSWCGIYYLQSDGTDFDERSGINRFYDPRTNADHFLDAGASYLNANGILDIEPAEGQVVIFPSYLMHSALPYFGEQDRIVIAFNARVDLV